MPWYVVLPVFLLSLSVPVRVAARPQPAWAFTCAPETFATLDAYLFTDHDVVHVVQFCENGDAQGPWPRLTDAQGNVWWIYAYVDVSHTSSGAFGYCIVEVSTGYAAGECVADPATMPQGHVRYLLHVPDVD